MSQNGIIRFFLVLTVTLLSLWLVCHTYDHFRGNADGLLGSVVYTNVFAMLLSVNGVGFLVSLGLTVRQKIIQNLALSILSGLFFLLLFEGIGHLVLALKLVRSSPFEFRRFYISPAILNVKPFPAGDLNSVTGRSHVPNGSYKFMNCEGDSIGWLFNSAGSNDRERSVINLDLTKKRVALVGDSFLEGFMVNNSKRLSSILEQKTGLEHLNFAVNSSSPINYYLTYKSIVKAYDADILIVGFLPANDFESYTDRKAYGLVDWPIYNPYWQGTYPNYKLQYSLASVDQSIFYGNHTQLSLLKVVDSVYAVLTLSDKLKANFFSNSSILRFLSEMKARRYKEGRFTTYEQFDDDDWNYVSYSLIKLIKEAEGRKVILLSIPTLWDLNALKRGKVNRIDPLLAKFCQQNGVEFIPLASSFMAYKGNLEQLYVPCDGHWSVQGEAYAADVIFHHPVYRSLVSVKQKL